MMGGCFCPFGPLYVRGSTEYITKFITKSIHLQLPSYHRPIHCRNIEYAVSPRPPAPETPNTHKKNTSQAATAIKRVKQRIRTRKSRERTHETRFPSRHATGNLTAIQDHTANPTARIAKSSPSFPMDGPLLPPSPTLTVSQQQILLP